MTAQNKCHPECWGNDQESFCELTQGPYCAITNPELVDTDRVPELDEEQAWGAKPRCTATKHPTP